jgi:hypothetical protein
MDETTGQQLSIPLSDLAFDASGNLVPSGWPLYQQHKATVDSLLKYLLTTGAIYPAASPSPAPAMVIEAKQQGSSGNNIQLEFSKVGTTDPNDPTKFDAKLTETEVYNGLTKDTIEGVVGTPASPGTTPGLVLVTAASAVGRPANKVYSMSAGAAPFKLKILEADGTTQAFELQARTPTDAEAKYTNVTISGVSATDATDPHFSLAVSWQKSATGIKATDLGTTFAYEIIVSPPPGAAAPGVPANGVVSLRGGAEVAAATTAKAVVSGES